MRTGDSQSDSPSLPPWWEWEIELSPHVFKRMLDRGFNEVDLRTMLERPRGVESVRGSGRWLIHCLHDACRWIVVVEPLLDEEIVVVVTAYPAESGQQ